ncbi:MAG: Ldh family oxidoreductase [Anaerolineae bacterium]|nr:Ldh family oxidoreductase [Anaerolineae bacterium]
MSVIVKADQLRSLVQQIFERAGVPTQTAQQVAFSLVESNLVGHDSHGVLRVSFYLEMLREGRVNPHGEFSILHESATTALIDGGRNFGQVVARKAMDYAMQKAKQHDIGMVVIRNCGHTGRLGEYVVQAAEKGFIGMVFGSGSRPGGSVAPYLGTSPVFNTNPIAWGIPAAQHPPVFLDFATSACAWGKIQLAIDKGIPIPEGWLLDADGNPTTDPTAHQRGGVLLPFDKHKGYCFSFLIEALAGGLSGVGIAASPKYQRDFVLVMTAIHIAAFQPLEQFCQTVDELIAAVKAARKAPGVKEILVPGEPEWFTREERLRQGIELPEVTWEQLEQIAQKYHIKI